MKKAIFNIDGNINFIKIIDEQTEYIDSPKEQIFELKQKLASYDYKTSKYVDGEYSEEEWAAIVEQRKEWRKQIRELEGNNG